MNLPMYREHKQIFSMLKQIRTLTKLIGWSLIYELSVRHLPNDGKMIKI